jgi:hypothetical protein
VTRRAALVLAGCLSTALPLAACKGSPPTDAAPSPGTTAAPVESVPPDHLGVDELVEGPQDAFGIKLPRGLAVTGSLSDMVFTHGPFGIHPLVGYLRPRLQDGSVREGAESATFEHVKVPGKPGMELGIHIERSPVGGVNVTFRDMTAPPVPDLPDEESRWRAAGLTKQGRVLDPTHLE